MGQARYEKEAATISLLSLFSFLSSPVARTYINNRPLSPKKKKEECLLLFFSFLRLLRRRPESDRQQMISRGITSNLLQRFLCASRCLTSLYYLGMGGKRRERRTQLERPKTMPSIHLLFSPPPSPFWSAPAPG